MSNEGDCRTIPATPDLLNIKTSRPLVLGQSTLVSLDVTTGINTFGARVPKLWGNVYFPPCVTCHMQNEEKKKYYVVELVGEGSVINGATPSSFPSVLSSNSLLSISFPPLTPQCSPSVWTRPQKCLFCWLIQERGRSSAWVKMLKWRNVEQLKNIYFQYTRLSG